MAGFGSINKRSNTYKATYLNVATVCYIQFIGKPVQLKPSLKSKGYC